MIGLIVTLLVARVSCETHSVHYQRHVSRRSRSNAAPFETKYIYSQVNNDPNAFEVFTGENVGAGGFNTIPVYGPSARRASLASKYRSYKQEHSGDHLTLKPIEIYNKNLIHKLKVQPDYHLSSYISYDMPTNKIDLPPPVEHTNRDFFSRQSSDVSTETQYPRHNIQDHNILDHVATIDTLHRNSKRVFPNYPYKDVQETKLLSLPKDEKNVSITNSSTFHSYSDLINTQAQPVNPGRIVKGDILLDNFDKWPLLTHVEEDKTKNIKSHSFALPLNVSGSYNHISPSNYSIVEPKDIEYARQKAKAKLNSNYFMPSKMDTDALYERLKALMHYTPPTTDSIPVSPYHSMYDYHMDDNDIRSGMTSSYDSSPYFFKNAYDMEHSRFEYEMQKSKDKRYAIDTERDHIPVHEPMHETLYDLGTMSPASTPENPVDGDKPFFSFVLNDYFQKNDEDPINFKGIDTWGHDFDYEASLDESLKQHNLPHNEEYPITSAPSVYHRPHYNSYEKIIHSDRGDSATDKGYTKNHEYNNQKKGNDLKSDYHSGYKHEGNNYKGFKDFIDSFVNKFGKENVKKDSKYKLLHNQDKGEKKKGFRKVYHKDEYQEEDEFYDNTNKSANAEETGSLAAHNKAVEAYLKSHSGANLHDEAKAYNRAGNLFNSDHEKNRSGHGTNKGSESQFSRYRDEAKKIANRDN